MKIFKTSALQSLQMAPLLCLMACASIDVPAAPEFDAVTPARSTFVFAMDETATVTPTWWRQFDDPALVSLVELALKENRTLEAARANLAVADSTLKRARLERSYNAGSSADLSLGNRNGLSDVDLNLSGALSASWEYDAFGRIDAQIRSAELNRAAMAETKRDIAVLVASQTAQAYVDLRGAQQRLKVAEASAELQAESLGLLRELADAGRSNDLDFNRAESLYLTTRASLPVFRANVETARTRLAALTSIAAGNPRPIIRPLLKTGDIPVHRGPLSSGTPADLIRRRPDIRAAEARIAQQLALGEVERSRLFPVVTFNASLNSFFDSLRDVSNVNSLGFGIGPSISWEGPDLRRVRADIDINDMQTRAAIATYEQTVFDALSDVESSLALYKRELERRDDLVGASEAAEKALNLAQLRFQEGLDDFLDVLDAQRTLLETRDDLVQNDILMTTYAISAYRAFGGMWSDKELQDIRYTDPDSDPDLALAPKAAISNTADVLESQTL